MVEKRHPDDADVAGFPGPEDEPGAPRDAFPPDTGDADVDDIPPAGDIGDGEAPAFDRGR
jgi:hypothetical protein